MNRLLTAISIFCICAAQAAHAYGENGYDSIQYYDPSAVLVSSKVETKLIPVNRLKWFTAYSDESFRDYQLNLNISDITTLSGRFSPITLDAGRPIGSQDVPVFDLAMDEATNDPVHPGFFVATVTKNQYLVHNKFDQDEFGDPIPISKAEQPFCLLVVELHSGQQSIYFDLSPNWNTINSIEAVSSPFCED